jgi:Metallo-peptidase family M12
MRCRHSALAVLLGFCMVLVMAPVLAHAEEERVTLIVTKALHAKKSHAKDKKSEPPDTHAYAAVKKKAGETTGHAMSLTKAETWSVPKSKVEAVKKAAAKFCLTVTEVGEKSHDIFHFAPNNMKLTDKQRSMMDLAKSSKGTMGVKLVMGPSPAMLEHALTRPAKEASSSDELAQIIVSLSDDTTLTINRTSVDIRPDKGVWRGTVESTGARVTLMWWPSGKISGTVQHDGRMFGIRHLGGRAYAIIEMDEKEMPEEHAPMPSGTRTDDPNLRDDPLVQQGDASILRRLIGQPAPSQTGKQQLAALPKPVPAAKPKKPAREDASKDGAAKDIVIDVIVAYTKKAASHYADVRRELVEFAIEEGNESFRNSGLGHIKLRLVYAYQTNYVEKGGHFDHVWRFADKGDGYMDEIHGLRDKYRGDVAILIVDDPSGCGLSTRVYAGPEEAFAVVHHACAVMTYSVAHEIGHLIGARHDLSMDTSTAPFPYGHGYVEGTWRDIMSYKQSCGGCPRLPIWSSPNVQIKGKPAGTPDIDNARVISEQAARVAAFR